MRRFSLSLMLASVLTLGAAAGAGSSEASLPGVGTFAYSGTPAMVTSRSVVLAAQ